ncbi:MAG: DNA mismatch repair protein MutS, partial [Gemmatimonadales bacterium]
MTPPTTADRNSAMMKQWADIKARHQGALLWFRVGDFYEMFHDDARTGARVLDITLTSRGDGIPLAGVPVRAAAEYLRQALAAGHRVAICEQVEDPKLAKGLVRREVVQTITPGALLEDGWIPGTRNNWIVAVSADGWTDGPMDRTVGLAAIDLSTGEFMLETLSRSALPEAISRLSPAEIVRPVRDTGPSDHRSIGPSVVHTERDVWHFDPALAADDLARHFGLASLDGLGLTPADASAVGAAGALIRYLGEIQPGGLGHLARPRARRADAHLWVDEMTRRNLELVDPLRAGARGTTLLETIDCTLTPMGARLLRQWLLSPLREPSLIVERLDAVEACARDTRGRGRLREAFDGVRDLERLAGRAAAGRATPRELGA